MKTNSILLTVICFAMWVQQTGFADPSGGNTAVPAIAIAPRSGAMQVAVGLQPTDVPHQNAQRRVATPDTKRNLPSMETAPTHNSSAAAIGGPATPMKSTTAITGQSAKTTPGTAALNGRVLGRKH